jgi:hypothetical protein
MWWYRHPSVAVTAGGSRFSLFSVIRDLNAQPVDPSSTQFGGPAGVVFCLPLMLAIIIQFSVDAADMSGWWGRYAVCSWSMTTKASA